jgi:predicted nucleic acid-binding protein
VIVLDASAVLELLLGTPAGIEVSARHAHEPLLDRVWALRHNLSANDAVYVALAEVLDASLVTSDRRLAHAPGMKGRAILI